ncbi:MAG: DUF1080 domain-containing protein [Planctomycetota bacterium]
MKPIRNVAIAALLVSLSTSAFAGDEDFVGRWGLEIEGNTDTFKSAWLRIDKGEKGLTGSMVWKWGSVGRLQNVRVENGELLLKRGKQPLRARLLDGRLSGTFGKKKFTGRLIDEFRLVDGKWAIKKFGNESGGWIKFQTKEGKTQGEGEDKDGNGYVLENVTVKGRNVAFVAKPKDGGELRVEVEFQVNGFRAEGEASAVGENESVQVEFERHVEWGKPLDLLAKGIEGFEGRVPNKFRWSVQDGILKNGKKDGDIVSRAKFGDFKLELEYKVDKGSNSGIYLRGRYELQILGDKARKPHGNMAVYSRLSPKVNPLNDFDQWQKLEVTMIGRYVNVTLNGTVVHKEQYLEGLTGGAIDPWEDKPGPLLLQGDHGPIQFRNIKVTPAK